ncbi:large conductance mechanosensitive channel protein MscL [Salinibacterium hongtaonis]|uniref:large conductance mechanosensitive channel protein MscL n=1 Tax=Homoserinimonas hongtaonis TaxID=2079791 RepID=UPI001E2EA35D|nr:large conductance mechanosensitive channel protein MscL [Salinibacterium hongtaonis]
MNLRTDRSIALIKGFKEFIMRGNVIDLAVAVVIGAAFTAIVNALVEGIFNPAIGALFDAEDLKSALILEIPTTSGEPAQLMFGAVIAAAIQFLLVAAVVYFVLVTPVNYMRRKAEEKRKAGIEEPDAPASELDLLAEIRDLLSEQKRAQVTVDAE